MENLIYWVDGDDNQRLYEYLETLQGQEGINVLLDKPTQETVDYLESAFSWAMKKYVPAWFKPGNMIGLAAQANKRIKVLGESESYMIRALDVSKGIFIPSETFNNIGLLNEYIRDTKYTLLDLAARKILWSKFSVGYTDSSAERLYPDLLEGEDNQIQRNLFHIVWSIPLDIPPRDLLVWIQKNYTWEYSLKYV